MNAATTGLRTFIDARAFVAKGSYQEQIQRLLAERQLERFIDPRHVEAWMIDARRTLDGLSIEEFRSECATAVEVILFDHAGVSERLAESLGL